MRTPVPRHSQRRRLARAAVLAVAALFADGAAAQTCALIEIPARDPAATAARLLADGFDVLPLRPAAPPQLVVTPEELASLVADGFAPVVLQRGRPFAEIQAEQQAALGDSVPAGYPTLAQIQSQMAALAAAHPTLCEVVDLTATYGVAPTFNGNHLSALRISDNVTVDEDEPTMLLVATHHCRELGAPVVALDAAQRLLSGYGLDPQITAAVNGNEIWIAPVWNPDGYQYVFSTDNLWRKNRRVVPGGVGIDLNRNYPFGWSASCSGSTQPSSDTYKGPSAASEAETATMLAWSADRHWAKVLDYHSFGSEVLWGYNCLQHPLAGYLMNEAIALSVASGYGGANRNPSAEGEEEETQLAKLGSHAFLIEIGTSFQPTYASSVAEAAKVWPGIEWMLAHPLPIAGHVTDACTHLPLAASVSVAGLAYSNGETNTSGGPFGRYAVFVPAGGWSLTFSSAGHASMTQGVVVPAGGGATLDVALAPLAPTGCITDVGDGKAGGAGVPVLAAQGQLASGTGGTLTLSAAAPGAVVDLIVGLAAIDAPFKGGTLVPEPDLLVILGTDAAGGFTLPFVWPSGLPAGLPVWLQAWIEDASATRGLAASNGLQFVAG